jgi:hypothetical protein
MVVYAETITAGGTTTHYVVTATYSPSGVPTYVAAVGS